jgi:preprotein translocase subunit SecE
MGPQGTRARVMGKEKAAAGGSWGGWPFLQELLKVEIYKRSQGKIVRQLTCLTIWVAFALGAWRMHVYMDAVMTNVPTALIYLMPSIVLLLGLWVGYRVVNLPSFADFLIAVEAEMNKVSWPSRTELVRSSIVVIVLMFGLTIVLFTYDTVWFWLLRDVLRVTV